MFSQTPAAIAVVAGPEQRYLMANGLYQQLFNHSEKELLGKSIREVFSKTQGQGIAELFEVVYQSGEAFTASEFPALFDRNGIGL